MDTYTTKAGDQWDEIALSVYGDELYMDWLMSNNLILTGTYRFSAGTVLQTPELPETRVAVAELPPWRTDTDDTEDSADDSDSSYTATTTTTAEKGICAFAAATVNAIREEAGA